RSPTRRCSDLYDGVEQLAAELTKMGCDIISGGGPGIMQAANEGALSADPKALHRSVGIRVYLPFEQELNPFVGLAYEHRTFFSRLHPFMIASDAFVVVPGGFLPTPLLYLNACFPFPLPLSVL